MAGSSAVQVRTVEVAIESKAGEALGNLDSLIEKLESLAGTIDSVVSKAGGLSTIGKGNGRGFTAPTKGIEKTAKASNDAAKQVDKFMQKMNATGFTGKSAIQKAAEETSNAIVDYKEEMRRFGVDTEQKGIRFLMGEGTETKKRADVIAKEARGYRKASDVLGKRPENDVDRDMQKIADLTGHARKASDALAELARRKNEALSPTQKEPSTPKATDSGNVVATTEAQAAMSDLSAEATRHTSIIQRLKSVYMGLRDGVKIAATGLRGFSRAVQALANPLKLVSKAGQKFKEALGLGGSGRGGLFGNRGFGRFLGLMLVRRAIMSMIRALVSGIKEGSDNLARYSSDYNHSISSMTSGLGYLKNAWAAAFAPIVNVVAPYISAFISMLASALNAIGRFLAALTGKGFAVQAKPIWKDYADSLGGAASGAGKAAKAAKEYQKTLMSFDQIHALNSPDNSSSGGGGGGGGGGGDGLSVNDMFETVSIESSMKDFANKIRDAIARDDWFGVGQIIAEKMNEQLDKALANDAFNKFGEKVAKTLNRAIDSFAGWSTTFHFGDLGKGIGQAINSALNNLHWENLGLGLGAFTNGLWSFVRNAIAAIDWKQLGTNIRDGLAKYFETVNWTEIRQTLTTAFEALLDLISGLLEGNKLGRAIMDSIDEFFSNVNRADVVRIGAKVAKVLMQIIQFAAELMSQSPLAIMLGFDGIDLSGLFDPFYESLDYIIEKNSQVEKSVDKLGKKTQQTAKGTAQSVKKAGKESVSVTDSGTGKVTRAVEKAGKAVERTVNTTASNANKTAKRTPADIGREFSAGHSKITTAVNFLFAPLATILGKVKTQSSDTGKQVPQLFKSGTDMYQNNVYNAAVGLMNKYGGGINDKIGYVKTKVSEVITAAKNKFNVPNDFKPLGGVITAAVGTGMTTSDAKKKISNSVTAVINAFKSAFGSGNTGATYNAGYNLGQSVIKGINAGIRSIGVAKLNYRINYTTINGNRVATSMDPHTSYIKPYAAGGLIQSGELFVARENGLTEMIGRIGNRGAVANNQQIVEGIEAGVARGMMAAMAATSNANGNTAPYEINITVKTQSDEVLARAVERGNAKRKYRLGTATA